MMATTHALAGLALAALVAPVAPEHAPTIAAAGLAGGVFPDLDLYAGHRRTLHFPVYYGVAAALAAALAVVSPSALTVGAAVFLAAAALHAAGDALGGGLELEPWRATSERAVYSHFHGRWIRPRRLVRYDGAPEDVAVAAVLGVPAALALGPPTHRVVAAALAVSAGYAAVRKYLPTVATRLVAVVPEGVRRRVPDRFSNAGEQV
ncbi:metal-dependent hydrolase [Halobacterium litoreum]|uniref:Metal-dependent hydrolase n=1 Tax=Halobacterium litoreum TaxID=2039234 RepID=A0ABD5NEV4_9EURY|nr:metal-dependent hydrolase [Halobacterium litoreum]UHH13687.1 metal-dependent hydrolase [Halobacterium litoreum]